MLLRALSVPDMPMQVQLERSIEAAILCEGMGLKVSLCSGGQHVEFTCTIGRCVSIGRFQNIFHVLFHAIL